MGKWGPKDNPQMLERKLRQILSSRGVNVDQLVFKTTSTKKGKVLVEAYQGEKKVASANVDRYGEIKSSCPRTDPKQGW